MNLERENQLLKTLIAALVCTENISIVDVKYAFTDTNCFFEVNPTKGEFDEVVEKISKEASDMHFSGTPTKPDNFLN
jgi:hypothetical protein